MAHTVKVIEQCQVGPPPGSVPSPTTIPLTFFDLPWLLCPPIKRIFFYEFPHSTHHFTQKVLPNLKRSLSLTLQHFYPFSSNILLPPKPQSPHILYVKGDSLSFLLAEATSSDLNSLVTDTPRDATCLQPLVPNLRSPRGMQDGTLLIPTMAIQVTVFPNSGFSVCLTFRHVAADGWAFRHFMRFWASLCKGELGQACLDLPLHDRDKIQDPNGLKQVFLEALWNGPMKSLESMGLVHVVSSDTVHRTFVLGREHAESMKKFVSTKFQSHHQGREEIGTSLHVSTFVVTCALFWVCKVKSEDTKNNSDNDDELHILAFMADCRNLSEFLVPLEYFGNCVVCGNAEVKRGKLVGENGFFEAAIAIGSKVRWLKSEAYKGAETLMSNFTEFATLGKHMLVTAGSPRMDVYKSTDFGWGRPKKYEVVQLDSSGSISLSDSRDKEGGIEVGIALGRIQMHKFNSILGEFLAEIAVHDA